uniref:Uncharacterized protein n=1 Tax=Meloidogyne incognita TaxID=6306 RepID=A0A914MAR6_MELIC
MASCVGYAWRYLEQRAAQNSTAQPPKREYSFVVESDEDDESLLGFMKNVEIHKELIPPPAYLSDHRQLQIRRNQIAGRINVGGVSSDPHSTGLPRQKQNTDVAMTANAFSDLDAIAEMGAGADDQDSQSQISGQNTPCLPHFNNDCPQIMSQQPQAVNQSTKDFDQRLSRINQISGIQQQNSLLQLSPLEQQRMSAFRQQQQKLLAGVSSYRMMQQNQSILPQSGSEVFDFDDSSNFVGAINSPSYQSPGGRCRGRGRRGGGNVGDRQHSFSSLETESTPASPSDFLASGKKRGVSGQRKQRKPRTREIALASDEKLAFSYQPVPFQAPPYQRQQSVLQQQVSMSGHLNYNISSNEEEVRSRMMTEYEMAACESFSSDEEMDPPPPPRNLHRESTETEKDNQQGEKSKIKAKHSGSCESQMDETSQRKINEDFSLAEFSKQQMSSLSNNQSYEKPQQQKQRLINSQLTSTNSSSSSNSASVASSPPQQRQSELNNLHKISGDFSKDLRKTSKTSLKEIEELKEIKQEIKINSSKSFSPFPEYYFEDSSTQNIKKEFLTESKEEENKNKIQRQPSVTTIKPATELKTKNKNSKIKEKEIKKLSNQSSTEDLLNKKAKIVLKIKPQREGGGGGIQQQSQSKNNSSSSPSSSSSSSISTSINISQTTTFQQAIEQQPIARLSSSGAPPSKFKQQQQKSGGIKRPAIEEIIENVKLKKSKKEGKNSPTQQLKQQSNIKNVKENNKNKEVFPQTTATPFPSLKNFKIPKVVETDPAPPPPPPQQQQQNLSQPKTEQQQNQRNFSGDGGGRINKYSTESSSNNPSSSSYGGGAGDYNSRKYGEKKGTTTANNWDNKTQQQTNYLPQHIRQQKGPVKPSKHPNINDSNRNKKFTGGPPNLHNERRGHPPSGPQINRNQQPSQQQKYYSSIPQQRDIPNSGFSQNWQSYTNQQQQQQPHIQQNPQILTFSSQRNWPTNQIPQGRPKTNILRYEVNLPQQAGNSPQVDDGQLQIVDEE